MGILVSRRQLVCRLRLMLRLRLRLLVGSVVVRILLPVLLLRLLP